MQRILIVYERIMIFFLNERERSRSDALMNIILYNIFLM